MSFFWGVAAGVVGVKTWQYLSRPSYSPIRLPVYRDGDPFRTSERLIAIQPIDTYTDVREKVLEAYPGTACSKAVYHCSNFWDGERTYDFTSQQFQYFRERLARGEVEYLRTD